MAIFLRYPHMTERGNLMSLPLLKRALTPSWWAPSLRPMNSSKPYYLPKALPPDTITFEIRTSTCKFWGYTVHNRYQTKHLSCPFYTIEVNLTPKAYRKIGVLHVLISFKRRQWKIQCQYCPLVFYKRKECRKVTINSSVGKILKDKSRPTYLFSLGKINCTNKISVA